MNDVVDRKAGRQGKMSTDREGVPHSAEGRMRSWQEAHQVGGSVPCQRVWLVSKAAPGRFCSVFIFY